MTRIDARHYVPVKLRDADLLKLDELAAKLGTRGRSATVRALIDQVTIVPQVNQPLESKNADGSGVSA